MAIAYYQGDPSPWSLIITQLRDRHEVAAPVDGHSIIVQMGEGLCPVPHLYHKLDYNPETKAMISS